jgi:hypothetical protein
MQATVCLINWDQILSLFQYAEKRLVLVLPAIHDEWVLAINEFIQNPETEIWVCFDNQEKAFRNGYGDIKAINQLRERGAFIKQSKDLQLGFLQADNEAYALFLESRMLGGEPKGYNAIALPPAIAEDICKAFFPEKYALDLFAELPANIEPFNEKEFSEVQTAIKENPPTSPDLQREISVYNNHFQFVELKLEGGNLTGKSVNIPSSALPFKDASMKEKMNTRYNLFEKEDTEEWTEIKEIKEAIEKIREKFLTACSVRKGKRVLKKEEKILYQAEIKAIEGMISKNTKALEDRVTNAILNAELSLTHELKNFLNAYPPDTVKPEDSPQMRAHKIERAVNTILDQTKFPAATDLISKLKLVQYFYDLTWEDLHDSTLTKWFVDSGLITGKIENELTNIGRAFEAKK